MEDLKAIGIRQPYAEAILRRLKRIEYRTRPTNFRGRFYIYAGLQLGNLDFYPQLAAKAHTFPRGKVVGTVELTDCTLGKNGEYQWHLAKPKRLHPPVEPQCRAQVGWFYPFKPRTAKSSKARARAR